MVPKYGADPSDVSQALSTNAGNLFDFWRNGSAELPNAQDYGMPGSGNENWHRFLSLAQLVDSFDLRDEIFVNLPSNQGAPAGSGPSSLGRRHSGMTYGRARQWEVYRRACGQMRWLF